MPCSSLSPAPRFCLETKRPWSRVYLRTQSRKPAFSPITSAKISWTQAITAATSGKSLSASTNFAASACKPSVGNFCTNCAIGIKPASLAIVALVRRFCLYGRYKSSTACIVSAATKAFIKFGVIAFCSVMAFSTVALRACKSSKRFVAAWMSRIWTSSKLPVTSLR